MWDLKHWELCCSQRGPGGFVAICPSQEAAPGMDVLTWLSHPSKNIPRAKELAQTGGIHTSTHGGKVKPGLEFPGWLNNRKKKKSLNLDVTWK